MILQEFKNFLIVSSDAWASLLGQSYKLFILQESKLAFIDELTFKALLKALTES